MKENNYLISYRTLRRLIGLLGMALPFLCWGINSFVNHFNLLNNPFFVNDNFSYLYTPAENLKSSISHFYYTTAGPVFTGTLITVAVFLFTYKGHQPKKNDDKFYWLSDKLLTRLAAICALGIVVFPTSSTHPITDNIYVFVSSDLAGGIHLAFAALFFLCIAMLSIVNFRRQPHKQFLTNAEGKTYLICGIGIIACLLIMAVYSFTGLDEADWLPYWFTYLVEVIMLVLFGIAWLTKGKSVPTEMVLKML